MRGVDTVEGNVGCRLKSSRRTQFAGDVYLISEKDKIMIGGKEFWNRAARQMNWKSALTIREEIKWKEDQLIGATHPRKIGKRWQMAE